jgi:hypothetical protein
VLLFSEEEDKGILASFMQSTAGWGYARPLASSAGTIDQKR